MSLPLPSERMYVDLGAEAGGPGYGLTLRSQGPFFAPAVRMYNSAIDIVNFPIQFTGGIGRFLYRCEEAVPKSSFAPALKAAMDCWPRPIALGQIPPGCFGTNDPQDTVQDAPMIHGGSPDLRLLGRQQRREPHPLLVCQFVSAYYVDQYTLWSTGLHTALVRELLAANPRLETLEFLVASPDLNPSDHVWKAARRAVSHNHDTAALA